MNLVFFISFSLFISGCSAFASPLDVSSAKPPSESDHAQSIRAHSIALPQSAVPPSALPAQHSLRHELSDWHQIPKQFGFASDDNTHKKFLETPSGSSDRFNKQDNNQSVRVGAINLQLIDTPVEQVLHGLAHDAGLSLALHQKIEGNATLLAQNQSLTEVLTQLAMQVPLHWQIEKGALHLWGDKPFVKSYAVDYLNMDRSTRSRVGLATQVGTINASLESSGAGSSNSSQTALENSADHHFWDSLAVDLDGLIGYANETQAHYTINRDAGMVTLRAPAALHENLKNYLNILNTNAQRQVLIEATVVEVALSENFQAGIDWQLMSNTPNGINAAQILNGSPTLNASNVNRIPAPSGLLSLVQKTDAGTITGTLNLLEQFGDVRILSKPRIIALNNQTSVLKVVDNRVYFTGIVGYQNHLWM